MINKRLILVGPTASGKNFLRKKFEDKGFIFDVSYTSRPKRPNEKYGEDYNFISWDEFTLRISQDAFYEYVKYNGFFYGTGKYEWDNFNGFIMETDGIKHVKSEDRKSCFIIYLNISEKIRTERMIKERGWNTEEIKKRLLTDIEKFKDFSNYDMIITNPNF